MLEFYLAELRRFRNGAAACCAANFILLTVAQQMINIPGAPFGLHLVMLLFYMLSGLGFALYQFGSYRQPSRWIWLQHRPVHRARILAALALAAVTLIAVGVALPLFALLAVQDHYAGNVIDARHYAGAAYLALAALCGWLGGGYMMLHRSRWAFVVLVLPAVLTMRYATAATVLALTLACVILLLALLYTVFRPNRYTADDVPATVAAAIPMQVCFYIALLWGGSILFQAGQMLAGVHPQLRQPARAGGVTEARRFNPPEALLAGLAGSADPRAAGWRASLDKSTTAYVGPTVEQYAVRDLMTTKGMGDFMEGENAWTFSHDRMQYHGVNRRTGVDQGWFGTGGPGSAGRFETLPVGVRDNRGGNWLADPHHLYRIEGAGPRLSHVLRVDGREQLAGGVAQLGQRTLVLTNRRLAVLAPSSAAGLPLPQPFGDLERVDAAQVPDGILVSLLYGRRQADGAPAARQLTYLLDPAGRLEEVARRDLTHDFPLLYEHRAWWISPVLHALVHAPDLLIDDGTIPDDGVGRLAPLLGERPSGVWIAALAATLLAGLGAAWWTRRARLGPVAGTAWCLACLLLGVPALLSLVILQPRERAEAAARIAKLAAAK
jgi:hypothetical protein